jgi:poly(hydroxyalkanoate) depolymerase family esterase
MSAIAYCTPVVAAPIRVLLLVLLALGICTQVFAQTEVTGFGSNPGNLRMFKHVPAGLPANAPLVVALHGCAQSASSYDDEPGWQQLAERWKFALLLPQQQSSNNASSCFNWFEPGDTARDQGEALSIRQMVDRMIADHASAPDRVYITGLSAGGAMAATMLAVYPDVFAGGAIVSGLPHHCATSQGAAFGCMNPGSDLTPAQWGDKVRASSTWAGPWPIVSIWHGDSDYVVRQTNATESMEQWTDVHGIDQTADLSGTVAGYPRRVYNDAAGNPRVETYSITGMGHGTPVDPGSGETQCGTAGAYVLDANICSSYYIARFWGLDIDDGGGGSSVTIVFDNEDANDGYVKAGSGGNAPSTGTLEAYYGLAIGRGSDGKFNRSVLSFDTSAIPDGATLTSAALTVAYRNAYGDPWSDPAGNALLIDANAGCIGACTIEATDWSTTATANAVAQLPPSSSGSQVSTAFSAVGLGAIDKGGRTQLRLRFAGDQGATSYLWIDRGAAAKLAVTYLP